MPQASAIEAIEEFKERTLNKLRDVRCPDHNQAPRVNFRGRTLREVSIQMNACCQKLAALANQKIAEPHAEPGQPEMAIPGVARSSDRRS